MATGRVTKGGLYAELGGAADQVTKAGLYVELIQEDELTSGAQVTQAGFYVEIKRVEALVTQAGIYTELVTEGYVSQAGLYVEICEPPPPKPSANREPSFSAKIQNPDFTEIVSQQFELQPVRWSWLQPGGCDRAEVEVIGNERNVWLSMPGLLRAPISILNNNKTACWWGYVNQVELYANGMVIGLSMDGLYNRVALAYNQLAAGGTTGTPTTTAWVQDDDSVDRFGRRELLATHGDATSTQAEAIRDGLLAAFRYVLPDVRPGRSQVAAKLICRGWWQTLGWRYYANAGTTAVALSEQIEDIITGVGEFFTGTDIVTAHDITSNEYRDGSETALAIIESFLATPLSTEERVTAWVTPERLLRFDVEQESGVYDWILRSDGQFRSYLGGVPDPGAQILGWTQLRGVLPASNWGYMTAPSPLYIEENEFDAESLTYTWRARGAQSPWI